MNLMLGDCLERMKEIPDGSVDMILADPPYGTTACKWDSVIPFDKMWKEINRIIKLNGAIVLFGSEPFSSHLRLSNLKMFQYDWIWQKTLSASYHHAKSRPNLRHEVISVFSYGKSANNASNRICYYPVMEKSEVYKKPQGKTFALESEFRPNRKTNIKMSDPEYNGNLRYPKTVVSFNNSSNIDRGLHPTQKPVPLLEYLIKTYTLENETVLDFTMGSGSTGVACQNLNRKFIGIEKDDKYFEIAKNRIFPHPQDR